MSGRNKSPNGVFLYQSSDISIRFVEADTDRVVVSFPDRIHPLCYNASGWGEDFLAKRGISAIYVALSQTNWFQCPDFFTAMRACREFLGPERKITAYGGSMGGYGALLAAKSLEASRCVAMSPQYSIDPEVVPFERRYQQVFRTIGPFKHDIATEFDRNCEYIIAYDPLHGRDRKHVSLYSSHFYFSKIPVYGSGHGVLTELKHANGLDRVADLLIGKSSVSDVRRHIRGRRRNSYRYLKKMNIRAKENRHVGLFNYEHAMRRLEGKNLSTDMAGPKVVYRQKPELIIHCGLPKTGTSSLQSYFHNHAEFYFERGIFYPAPDIDNCDQKHSWLSTELRNASVKQLSHTLVNVPEGIKTIFLSDEGLYVETPGLNNDARSALRAALDGFNIKLVLFEREEIAWMKSFYLQSVQNRRRGRKTSHDSARNLWQTPLSYKEFFAQPYCKRLLDIKGMRAELSKLFGGSSLTVLPYIPGEDTVAAFCTAMEWPRIQSELQSELNTSITDSQAEILRQANAHSNPIGRFIKKMIELPENFQVTDIRPKLRKRLLLQSEEFSWDIFEFKPNPPLILTHESFERTLKALQTKAARLKSGLIASR